MRTLHGTFHGSGRRRVVALLVLAALFVALANGVAAAVVTTKDSYEPDDTSGTAKALVLGDPAQSRTLHYNPPTGDVDWLYFEATEGTRYVIQTHDLDPTTTDTVLQLFAGDASTLLAENDDFGRTFASRITWRAPASGTYYVRVSGRHEGINGNYTITLRQAGAISGVVTAQGTGAPLAGITVDLWQYEQDGYYAFFETSTDAAGRYEFEAVPAGTWRVGFYDWSGAYEPQYYNGKNTDDVALGNNVVVTAGVLQSGINASLKAVPGSSPSKRIEHDAAGVTFDRFVTGYSAAYSGGGYVYGHGKWAGTKLQVRFTGSAIRWYGPKQPAYGMADVYVDGTYKGTVDCYAADADKTLNAKLIDIGGLADTAHTLEIRPKMRTATGGSIVVIDYFEVDGAAPKGGGTRLNESGAHSTFSGPWIYATNSAYIAGSYHYSRYTNAVYTATFTGTKVAWIGPRTGQYGRAKVYIDGVLQGTVSQYGTTGWRYRVWESKTLTRGTHTIKIVPTGTKDAVSKSTNIVIDALDVTP
jgi:5-hydroxyisourate hydrolase-like protein (transthyretin family)